LENVAVSCCNYLLGSVVTRVALKNMGYPVFTWVPSSRTTLDWKGGGRSGGDVYPYAESGNLRGTERDWTPYWESCLALLLEDVEELERQVLDAKRRDDALVAHVRADRALNHRQQDVLARAVVNPRQALRISEHQEEYDLAYSTARQDLAALVELGFFQMTYESKAQVYSARADLKGVLGRRYAPAGMM
jgi:Fic family protein